MVLKFKGILKAIKKNERMNHCYHMLLVNGESYQEDEINTFQKQWINIENEEMYIKLRNKMDSLIVVKVYCELYKRKQGYKPIRVINLCELSETKTTDFENVIKKLWKREKQQETIELGDVYLIFKEHIIIGYVEQVLKNTVIVDTGLDQLLINKRDKSKFRRLSRKGFESIVVECFDDMGLQKKILERFDLLTKANGLKHRSKEYKPREKTIRGKKVISDGLFEYFASEHRRGLKINIGTFLAHQVKWIDKNGNLLSPNEVNQMDRIKLAESFFIKRTANRKYTFGSNYRVIKPYEEYELINDIAEFIDLRIPKNYWINKYELVHGKRDRTKYGNKYKGINMTPELNYVYDNNYLRQSL